MHTYLQPRGHNGRLNLVIFWRIGREEGVCLALPPVQYATVLGFTYDLAFALTLLQDTYEYGPVDLHSAILWFHLHHLCPLHLA
jgi:hypothetical protein